MNLFIVSYCKIKVYSLPCFHIVKPILSILAKYDWKLRIGAAIMCLELLHLTNFVF